MPFELANRYSHKHLIVQPADLRLSPPEVPNLIYSRLYDKYNEERALLTELRNLRQRKLQRLREQAWRRKELEEITETTTQLQANIAIHELEGSSTINAQDRRRSTKALNKMYRMRKASVLHKLHEIGELCGANVFVQIERNSKVSQYKYSQRKTFPLTSEEIAQIDPSAEIKTAADYSSKQNTPPVKQ
ncbi:hypothetical protein K469DRAFT_752107 [Zopfia rhizophila CBS 207.26]|uniref:Uncharacterized protein n=1 Tax=Zopfia rhizophila CBS 207.26 TaxID=1314779 RepID=A0A6A6DYD8_9PEZI|nr:hypothetical protein K469DRAFT_752107 [Zopfia rhizophila CBS 207.26]